MRDRHCHLITCGVARFVTISRDCLSLRCAMRDASHILFLSVLGASRIGLTLDWRQRGFFHFSIDDERAWALDKPSTGLDALFCLSIRRDSTLCLVRQTIPSLDWPCIRPHE